MIPKTKESLEKTYKNCEKKFVKIDNIFYSEYQGLAYEDLDSAVKEENARWAISKAYQALFLMCNSILVKKLGVYSKNHTCVLIALLYNNLMPKDTLDKINKMLKKENLFNRLPHKESFFEEISNIRILRNKYLYLPKTMEKIKTPVDQIIEEIKELIKLLGEIE